MAKKDTAAAKTKDDDEDVLFEGELTWTHDPVPVSPELLKRTPRDDAPAVKAKHTPAPAEGSIELQDLREGGGEIFNVYDQATPPVAAAKPPAAAAETDPFAADVPETPAAPEAAQAVPAVASGRAARPATGGHGRTVMPVDGFSKASMHEGDPFARDQATAPPSRPVGPKGPMASQFEADVDPAASPKKRRQTILLASLSATVLLLVAGVLAYLLYIVPNQPNTVLASALATTLQQASVNVDAQAVEQDAAKQNLMQASVSGGISQAGSYDLTTRLTNGSTAAPLVLTARSIDGREAFVQGTALAQNIGYLSKLGLPATAAPTLQSLENKWVRLPAELRPTLAQGLGLDVTAGAIGGSDKQLIADAYKANPFLYVSASLPEVAIDGTLMRHYQLGVDKTKLTAFVMAAKSKAPRLGLTQAHIDAANKLDTAALRLEVWIDGETSLIAQVLAVKQKSPNSVSWTLRFTRYGETISLQQPTPATDVSSAFKQMVGPGATDTQATDLINKVLQNFSTGR